MFPLFFNFLLKDDFIDNNEQNECGQKRHETTTEEFLNDNLVELLNNHDNEDVMSFYNDHLEDSKLYDTSAEKSVNMLKKVLDTKTLLLSSTPLRPEIQNCKEKLNSVESKYSVDKATLDSSQLSKNDKKLSLKNSKSNHWIELFAELDPLANLEAFDLKISGNNKNSQQT